ncbi:S-layer homology domain-containing protein [Allocoleopsis franciscana]|uniref:Parallel beta-helix repeat (Two copies) n=1 Tax=Allocoleopsis franciscana PCC 7113 TaxID=1173027 RepID=K9WLC7_9CYAN|nr:S-layer homology domain-containing protein [Allocoleopsis franciscana]AFZ20347.1 parallel beta-helix repeat (two copies) [Allocoleopsis franciscana PCC 7113]
MPQTLYVNPGSGSDSADGSQSAPFKTIKKALEKAQSDTTIQLAAGNYTASSGEAFPLNIPSGVKVVGNEGNKGSGILIEGSGQYNSRTQAGQNITFLMESNAELRGVTVTNLASRGTAVWIESTAPTVANCTFTKSKREGLFATGDANPVVLNNDFLDNDGNGISITRNSTGEYRGNICKDAGSGISIDGTSAPKLVNNTISGNRYGLIISGESRPVLRNNQIENNTEEGVVVTNKAVPDLGSSKDPGNNTIRNNAQLDLNNATGSQLISFGNTLSASKVKGSISIDGIASNGGGSSGGDGGSSGGDGGSSGGDGDGKPPTTFADIQNHWAKPFIQALLDKGLITGFSNGTFRPDDKMTRAQYAALLVKAFNPTAKRDATKFTDVANDFWAKDVIQQAYRSQFISGFPNNTFRPNDNVQRIQVIVSLISGLGLGASDTGILTAYDDRNTIPDYAKDEVATATKKQIVVNYPQTKQLNPNKEATRGEVAAFVYQALVDAKQASAVNSPYIVAVQPDAGGDGLAFTDIKGHWAADFISALAKEGLISGFKDGSFKPDEKMTRAQYAALLVKAFNPTVKRDTAKFTDVANDYWAKDVIQQAYRGEFVSGFPNNTFRPNENVQKVQVLVSVVNGLGLSASDPNALTVYDDRTKIPDYAKDEVTTATKKKIVVNYPQTKQLDPTKEATRAEVAAIVYQALVDAKKVSAINSPYVVSA